MWVPPGLAVFETWVFGKGSRWLISPAHPKTADQWGTRGGASGPNWVRIRARLQSCRCELKNFDGSSRCAGLAGLKPESKMTLIGTSQV